METNEFQQRMEAHTLLDMLPVEKFNVVRSLLEVMVEPASMARLSGSLEAAPIDNAEITPETAASINHARASLARGEGISHDEVLREFGLLG